MRRLKRERLLEPIRAFGFVSNAGRYSYFQGIVRGKRRVAVTAGQIDSGEIFVTK